MDNIRHFSSTNYLFNNKQTSFSSYEEVKNMKSIFNKQDIFLRNKNNSSDKNEKICLMGKKCPFLKKYMILKNELKGLITSINKIKKINDVLSQSLEKKSKLYKILFDENEKLKKEYYMGIRKKYNNTSINTNTNINDIFKEDKLDNLTSSQRGNNRIIKKEFLNEEKKPIINLKLKNNLFLNINKKNEEIKNSQLFSSLYDRNNSAIKNKKFKSLKTINYSLLPTQSPEKNKLKELNLNIQNNNKVSNPSSKNIRQFNLFNNGNPELYYDLINKYTKHQKPKFISDKMKRSFLSYNINYETLIKNNNNLNKLLYLTKSEENFISILSSSSDQILLKYYDIINILINDFKDMLKLGIRMKTFIKNSISLVDSMIDNNSIKVLIENTCEVLSCDRVSLFILDRISDSLIVYSGEGIKKAQIKVPKDKGIVGVCFMEKKKIRIDDAYLDKRFNKEIDKKTNYRTRSILCYPLIDKQGECFGVIEAINKNIPPFNIDDEELIKLLSYLASIIFRSFSAYDDNRYLTIKLMIIINYNININNINNKFEFTEKSEDALLNIFDCMNSKFYFVENNKIIHYDKGNEKSEYDINKGIIGKVVKSKEILGYQSIKSSVDYNSIIDIDSAVGILTFPILEIKTKIIKGIVQVPYYGKIYENGKPKDSEVKLIKKFRKCVKYWIQKNSF